MESYSFIAFVKRHLELCCLELILIWCEIKRYPLQKLESCFGDLNRVAALAIIGPKSSELKQFRRFKCKFLRLTYRHHHWILPRNHLILVYCTGFGLSLNLFNPHVVCFYSCSFQIHVVCSCHWYQTMVEFIEVVNHLHFVPYCYIWY